MYFSGQKKGDQHAFIKSLCDIIASSLYLTHGEQMQEDIPGFSLCTEAEHFSITPITVEWKRRLSQ